jgi:hypothetical protein
LYNLDFGDSGSGTHIYTIAPGDGFYVAGNFTAGLNATVQVNGGIFDVYGTTTKGTGYKAGNPTPMFPPLTPGTGIISGAVYDDLNGSGQEQGTDPGLLNWTVNLFDGNGNFITSTTTGSTGGYSFLNLTPGTYSVQEVPQSGYTETATPSSPISVSAGNNVVANFGNFQNVTISGTVFNDANADGLQQLNELGIANTTVQLYTVTNGRVFSNVLQMTTTDGNGNYSFTNLGPLPAGSSYVVAQVAPAGTSQTKPASGSNTITLPDGRTGWLVPATGGVSVNLTGQPDPNISGTGSYTLNKLNNPTTATVKFNDGAGHSGSLRTTLSQFNVTFTNGVNAPVTFNTFCIDLFDQVSVGNTYAVAVQPNLASTYVNAGPMEYIYENFGLPNLSNNPTQAAAVQVAEWDLSLNVPNRHSTQFIKDADGTYSSGDESTFSVNFGNNPNAAAIATLVNQYLHISAGASNQGGWLDSSVGPSNHRGQNLLIPETHYNYGDFTPPSAVPGTGCAPPTMLNENSHQVDNGPVYCPICNPCVQASTGVVNPEAMIFGSGGQDPISLNIGWSNGSYSAGSNMGSGINNSLTPSIVEVNGTQTLAVEIGSTQALYFDYNGSSYVERFGGNDELTYNPSTLQYTLDDTIGDQIVFSGFALTLPVGERGSFQSFTDPGGNVTQAVHNPTGQITDMQRTSNGVTESWLYSYNASGVNAGLVSNITLERQTNNGPIDVVRQAVFTYYDGTEPYGNVGDLEFLTVEDSSNNVLGTYYYRYYTPTDAGSGGYVGGLKYYFSERSYAQLTAAVGNPTTAGDSQVAPYADDYYHYDSSRRLTQAVVQGEGCSVCSAGLGTFTFSYTTSSNSLGYNSWAVKTVMTHPDGSTDTIYSNYAGETMLDSFTDATTLITTNTYYRYDIAGRAILEAMPSAVIGYDDSYADLVNYQNGTYQYLSANSGLIDLTTYYTSTTATAMTPGGVTRVRVRHCPRARIQRHSDRAGHHRLLRSNRWRGQLRTRSDAHGLPQRRRHGSGNHELYLYVVRQQRADGVRHHDLAGHLVGREWIGCGGSNREGLRHLRARDLEQGRRRLHHLHSIRHGDWRGGRIDSGCQYRRYRRVPEFAGRLEHACGRRLEPGDDIHLRCPGKTDRANRPQWQYHLYGVRRCKPRSADLRRLEQHDGHADWTDPGVPSRLGQWLRRNADHVGSAEPDQRRSQRHRGDFRCANIDTELLRCGRAICPRG